MTVTRVCSKCGAELPLDKDHFPKAGAYFRKQCRDCYLALCKKYYDNHRSEISKRKQKHYKNNKEQISLIVKERNSTDKARQRNAKYKRRYYKTDSGRKNILNSVTRYGKSSNGIKKKRTAAQKRYHNDIRVRLRGLVSTVILLGLKRGGSSKGGKSCLNYLGYSIEDLKIHLENLFEPWMNWNNMGVYRVNSWVDDDQSTWTWQIDHIIRHKEFVYNSLEDPKFKECWALSNLRPLSAKENIIRH